MKKRNFKEAVNCYSKAVDLSEMKENSDKPEYLANKGKCLMVLGEYKQAIQYFDESIRLKPNSSTYHKRSLLTISAAIC